MSENRDEKPNFPEKESAEQKEQERRANREVEIRWIFIFGILFVVLLLIFFAVATNNGIQDALLLLFSFTVGLYVTVFIYFSIHEMGHILFGTLAGLRPRLIMIRRLMLVYHQKKWRLRLISFKEVPLLPGILLGSSSLYTASSPENLLRQMVIMLTGGPIASAVVMLAGIGMLLIYQRLSITEILMIPVAIAFVFLPIVVLLIGISPRLIHAPMSDGYLIRKYAAGDKEAIQTAVAHIANTDNMFGVHPGDWHYDLLKEAARIPCLTHEHFEFLVLIYPAALSHKDVELAGEYVDAIQNYLEPANQSLTPTGKVHPVVYLDMAFFEALYRNNPEKARHWFERAPSQEEIMLDRRRAEAAILFAEGQVDQAIRLAKEFKSELGYEKTGRTGVMLWKIEELDALIARAWEHI